MPRAKKAAITDIGNGNWRVVVLGRIELVAVRI